MELLAYGAEGLAHLRLHRLDRDAQGLGDLPVLEAVDPGELEDLAAPGRQRAHRAPHHDVDLLLQHRPVGVGMGGRDDVPGIEADHDTMMADQVQRPVPGDLEQVGTKGGIENYIVPAAPQLQHHVLRDVLPRRPIPEDRLGEADQIRVIGAEDGIEPLLDSLPKPVELLLDRKSTRLNSVTWPYLVCRLLLEKKK